jgi:DTW domain-containing protein YfiP
MSSDDPVVPMRRARCPACGLPLAACLCRLVARVDNGVEVLVLQHPLEVHEAKGSVRLLRLSLARCRVVVGEVFDPRELEGLLHAQGRRSVMLYPSDADAGSDDAGERDPPGARPDQLVVLDGTWRKSLRMLKANPLLQALPRLSLAALAPSRYGELRKARRPMQSSSLEATCAALAAFDTDPARYAPLLEAFARFVGDRAVRAMRLPRVDRTMPIDLPE